ncbi:response regulator transcription factor [Psychrobium sp. 1_MG-2023]|nr:response regulator transcription factor [Psychrobium sp. 1_MG-2023]MDP2560317.1 response regulator transcription factor [Psychrobium sp. 1_MG-2023]PKF55497.1 DNA-binding response regulator [Alteromonadales bacterium alter-6D02]
MVPQIKIIIADDHPLFSQALSMMLETNINEAQVSEVDTISALEALLAQQQADLLLLDLDIPGGQGFNTLMNIRQLYPQLGVVIVSGIEDSDSINQAMSQGACGYIPKSTPVPEMVLAINEVLAGNVWLPGESHNHNVEQSTEADERITSLTPQQHKILLMFADGLLNKQIAYELGLSESTIKSHASTIFLKLGVKNRTQAVIMLNELQLANAVLPNGARI